MGRDNGTHPDWLAFLAANRVPIRQSDSDREQIAAMRPFLNGNNLNQTEK